VKTAAQEVVDILETIRVRERGPSILKMAADIVFRPRRGKRKNGSDWRRPSTGTVPRAI
jgi:hypothetical protein